MKRRIVNLFGIAVLVVALSASMPTYALVYHIEVRDLEPGQPLTPPVAVVHDAGYQLFAINGPATPGLETLAEDGHPNMLVDEANASSSVQSVHVGGSAPTFGSFKFFIDAEPGDLFSLVSMFARTNDNFIGVSSMALPGEGAPVEIDADVYDAGTEMNTGLIAHIPAYGNEFVGEEENGTIQIANAFTIQDDPANGQENFTWPPSAKIIITPLANALHYTINITGTSEGQPLTPPVVVVHDSRAQVFTIGSEASAGLEIIAEEGMPDTLVSELFPTEGVFSVNVAGTGPGFEHETSFMAAPGMLVSVVSMFARTNDVFIGINSVELPTMGAPASIEAVAYDAGTEMNTGLVEHIPFYGNAGGPDENGLVAEINSYSVLDDPDGMLDYAWPPAATITISGSEGTSNVADWTLYE
ncbi:MAG: spondin domain-containing protein [Candidatus Hinthialibacter antarcticus]|nr:spondin domain-containing protein [Candidatus Hinthialibacter antarcticus]